MSNKFTALQTQIEQLRSRWQQFWQARSEQEQRLLSICAVVVVLAVFYLVFIDPALSGRSRLEKNLPQLRLRAAEVQQLAQQAQSLAGQAGGDSVPQLDRPSMEKSLQSHGMKAQNMAEGSDYVKIQLSGVSFANVMSWLDEVRNVYHAKISEARIEAQKDPGNVDVSLTLRQATGEVS